MNYSFLSRIKILSFLILIFALILVAKLFLVQIVHSNSYSERADRQYVTPSSDIFERGTVFFNRKDGQLVSAAMQTAGFKLAIKPSEIVDAESIYVKLSEKIVIDYDNFLLKAEKKKDPYEEIINHLSKEQADKLGVKYVLPDVTKLEEILF